MRSLVALVLLALVLAVIPEGVGAEAVTKDWYAEIHVWLGKAHNRLTVGQAEQATEGHDNPEAPVPGMFLIGAVQSYFYHPEWKQNSPFFWHDIRSLGSLPKIWEFIVKTKQPNVELQLKWNLSRVRPGIQLYLRRKEDKEYINLHKQKLYIYKSAKKENVFLLKAEQISPP